MIKIKYYTWYTIVKYHLKNIAKNIHVLKLQTKLLRGITCKEGEELTGRQSYILKRVAICTVRQILIIN